MPASKVLSRVAELERTTGNDLQNVLNSMDVATLQLDTQLNIRLFTPAMRRLFNIIPSDVGRPFADLKALSADTEFAADAVTVLRILAPVEREIEVGPGAWYIRRILPYRQAQNVGGVVVTFADITERRRLSDALEEAQRQAQQANAVKAKFLAAASHDLRQPLQTLTLLQGLLSKKLTGENEKRKLLRMGETLSAMSGMLNAILDINQIEEGTVSAAVVDFPIREIFDRLKKEFDYHARAKGLTLRLAPCNARVRSDPRLLEQMIRNLLANAVKYTSSGKVLIGCRRKGAMLSVEVIDTGIGIAMREIKSLFDECHQVDDEARERSRGLNPGLSIVNRLAGLLDHRIHVASQLGKGSRFAIEIALADGKLSGEANDRALPAREGAVEKRVGVILIAEDDRDIRDALETLLAGDGHIVATAEQGAAAMELVNHGAIRPDLILADYNLPNGMNGLELVAKARKRLRAEIPVIILTGDISTAALRDIAASGCVQLNKPVIADELLLAIQRILPVGEMSAADSCEVGENLEATAAGIVYVVDDDGNIRDALCDVLEGQGHSVETFESCEAFLEAYRPELGGCLLIDAYLPEMSGLELLAGLDADGHRPPAIMITGSSDVSIAVQAMKAGAMDFIEKPVARSELLASVARALEQSRDMGKRDAGREQSADRLASLTSRQREIMNMVLAGNPSKNIAADLGISQRTVENHRAEIMRKTGSKSLPALARLAIAAV